MKNTQHTLRRHWALGPVLVLACALLWAQMLGLAHRVVHGPQLGGLHAVSQATAAALASESGAGVGEPGLWAQLLAGHQGNSDCRLFEQLNHADVLPVVAQMALPVLAPLPPVVVLAGGWLVCQLLPFQARGPPLTR